MKYFPNWPEPEKAFNYSKIENIATRNVLSQRFRLEGNAVPSCVSIAAYRNHEVPVHATTEVYISKVKDLYWKMKVQSISWSFSNTSF